MWLKAGALLILIFLSVEETEAAKVTIMMTSNLTVVDDGKLGRGQVCDEPSQKPARPKF